MFEIRIMLMLAMIIVVEVLSSDNGAMQGIRMHGWG